ncbi:hypothetical protein BDQ12DRAFT_729390 [Crucibulum laeve]|uniref:Uncharacterized protein n=1 Tax=Crucibulum laeve TaxID=68775 RepID=A0A5C3LES0_9AGAR|nr:hypothetical protein BDQ12DRAFT_729390 [Crucibulum laeve]
MANIPAEHLRRHGPSIPFEREPWTSRSKYAGMLLETFLFGLYIVLFSGCIYLLAKHKKSQRILLVATVISFALASADLGLTLFSFFRFAVHAGQGYPSVTEPGSIMNYKFSIYVAMNAITTGLFINRCYLLWLKKRIAILPTLLILGGTLSGFLAIAKLPIEDRLLAVSFISTVASNLIVTVLSAGRMMWTARKANALFGIEGRYFHLAASILVESGALYTLTVFLYLLVRSLVLELTLTQIAGIASCLMIAEVAYSRDQHNTATTGGTRQTVIETIRSQGAVTQTQRLVIVTVGLQRTETTSTDTIYSSKVER